MNNHYRSGTATLISLLQAQEVDDATIQWKRIKTREASYLKTEVRTNANGDAELVIYQPSRSETTKAIISDRRDELKKGGLAKSDYARVFFNRSPNQLNNIMNGKAPAPRDFILIGLLMMEEVYNSDDVNHALMESGHPGLFYNTYSKVDNFRNYILSRLFDHIAQITKETPQKEVVWPHIVNSVLDYLGCHTLAGHVVEENLLTVSLRELADTWMEEAETACKVVNYMVRRNQYVCRSGKSIQQLSELSHIGYNACHDMLSGSFPVGGQHSNHGLRDNLIWLGAALDCTLEEVNALLEEAYYAMVYPPMEQISDKAFLQILKNTPQESF